MVKTRLSVSANRSTSGTIRSKHNCQVAGPSQQHKFMLGVGRNIFLCEKGGDFIEICN
jgi:hypothetical protein